MPVSQSVCLAVHLSVPKICSSCFFSRLTTCHQKFQWWLQRCFFSFYNHFLCLFFFLLLIISNNVSCFVTGLKSKAEGYHCITQYLKFFSSDSVVLVKFGMSLKSHRDIFIPQRARREEYQE